MNKILQVTMMLAFVLLLGTALPAHAQISETTEVLVINTVPDRPKPNTEVTVRIQSFLVDLSRAVIDWRVNGVSFPSSGNDREITIPLGDAGDTTRVDVIVRDESGATFSKNITLRPASVDLLWEADSYIPPFYKGKASASSRSTITISAVPHFITESGARIDPRELVYSWKHNNNILGSDSGRGRSTITIEGPRTFRTTDIRVQVETADSSIRAQEFLSIDAIQPLVLFYENDPLLGVRYEKSFGSLFELTKEEASIVATPFYIAGDTRDQNDITYEWRVNGAPVNTSGGDPSTITVRPEGGEGEATIQLTIRHLKRILQQAQSAFTIRFSTQRDASVIPTL